MGGWAKFQRRSEADHETMTCGACLYVGLTWALRNKQLAPTHAIPLWGISLQQESRHPFAAQIARWAL